MTDSAPDRRKFPEFPAAPCRWSVATRGAFAAEAYQAQRTKRAQGDADRFLTVLKEYKNAKDVTRKRLYLEAMENVLPGVKKFIIAPEAGGNLLQFLPLEKGVEK